MKSIQLLIPSLTVWGLLNLSSFAGVGMQKLSGIESETAAIHSYYNYGKRESLTGVLYGFGLDLGHKIFYAQNDFREIAQNMLKRKK